MLQSLKQPGYLEYYSNRQFDFVVAVVALVAADSAAEP